MEISFYFKGRGVIKTKLTNTISEACTPCECAIGLVVTSKKCQILSLVTMASPVCTGCIIAQIQMHVHTPGSSTVLLITKNMLCP